MTNIATLFQANQGTTVPSGFVGETITGSITMTPSSTSGTYASTSLSISTGTWLVIARGYKIVGGTMLALSCGAGISTATQPTASAESGNSVQWGGGIYTSSANTVLNNSTGSIKFFVVQVGTSLDTSTVTIWYSATRIA